MNWEAIGAVGEILGAIGVVLTLLYLSIQTRNNTNATNAASAQAVSDKWIDVNAFIAEHIDELMTPITDASSVAEVAKVSSVFRVIFHQYQNIFIQYEKGLLDEQYFQAICRELPNRLNATYEELGHSNNMIAAWNLEKYNYTEDFQEFVESLIDPKH